MCALGLHHTRCHHAGLHKGLTWQDSDWKSPKDMIVSLDTSDPRLRKPEQL